MKQNNLVWIDLEMTGLDPEKHVILEIATIITDNNLEIIAEGPELVIHQPEQALQNMDQWVQDQHTKSGLLDAVRKSKVTIQDAEQQTLAVIKEHCLQDESVLCGNSVWMDKFFLKKYMPAITDYLHYRVIDVSTIKELAARWYPEQPEYEKKETHRALADIRESIDELKAYRKKLFI